MLLLLLLMLMLQRRGSSRNTSIRSRMGAVRVTGSTYMSASSLSWHA